VQREDKVEPERKNAYEDGPALLLLRWLEISLYLSLKFGCVQDARTEKKDNQISLIHYIKKFRVEQVQSIYKERLPIYEEMRKYFPIYNEAVSHI